jgi:hypothetical protein
MAAELTGLEPAETERTETMTNTHPTTECHCRAKNTFEVHKYGEICEEHARYTIPSQRTPGAVEAVCWVHRMAYMRGRNLQFANEAPVVASSSPAALPLAVNG